MCLGLTLVMVGKHFELKAHQLSEENYSHVPSTRDIGAEIRLADSLINAGLLAVLCGPPLGLGLWWCLGGRREPDSPRSASKTPRRG